MKRMLLIVATAAAAWVPVPAAAQGFDTVGTRAAGMSGAFVAVADDASATYWNPGGFATASYFSMVLDRTAAESDPAKTATAGSRSSFLLGLGMPALGVSYYRLRGTSIEPTALPAGDRNTAGTAEVRVNTLVTHHTGVTLVQTLLPGVSVGATLKLVRGIAASGVGIGLDRDQLLDDAPDMVGRASNAFDADIGVMASAGRVKAGVTVRNVTEAGFETPGGSELRLERQARAGLAVSPRDGWVVAADFDLLETTGIHGRMRDIALGAEGRVARRAFVRAGTRMNTIDDGLGHMPSGSVGGSVAVTGSVWVDGQATFGSDTAPRGWGIAARFVY